MLVVLAGSLTACRERSSVTGVRVGHGPDAPRALDGWYYDRAVHLTWELGTGWDGESFRVYGKRTSDAQWFLVAEVTNCTGGVCSYTDVNLAEGVSYEYFVVAVDPASAVESERTAIVEVFVPQPVPPPAPAWTDAVALDGAAYLIWDSSPADVPDFSHYKVYLLDPDGGSDFFLGETDSPGFLDERVMNGSAYDYRITAVDDQGHEGAVGPVATAIPRPDYHGEWLWAYQDRPADSGFRFRASEDVDPLVHGDDPARHFRIEVDSQGWWIVPGPGALLYQDAFATTALRCGPGSDASCVELTTAPATGY
ncbi:MAG: fibronectin type III domain-containing protein, partial [Longimicrobiales bacterium]|nr:fibronectin type III domain-containing protein [Longimicrobiales bacterium]